MTENLWLQCFQQVWLWERVEDIWMDPNKVGFKPWLSISFGRVVFKTGTGQGCGDESKSMWRSSVNTWPWNSFLNPFFSIQMLAMMDWVSSLMCSGSKFVRKFFNIPSRHLDSIVEPPFVVFRFDCLCCRICLFALQLTFCSEKVPLAQVKPSLL